jgi:hypothetical protein
MQDSCNQISTIFIRFQADLYEIYNIVTQYQSKLTKENETAEVQHDEENIIWAGELGKKFKYLNHTMEEHLLRSSKYCLIRILTYYILWQSIGCYIF